MTPEEILKIVREKKDAFKAARYTVDGIPSTKKDELSPPDFNPLYARCVRLWQKIRPHAEDEFFPTELFRAKAPNQKHEEFIYSKQMYLKAGTPTHSYWAKAISIINRVWNEKNYSIEYPEIDGVENESYPARDYFEKEYPEFKSIESYFREMVTQSKLADPNAWLCLDIKLPMEGEEIDQSKPTEPFMRIFPCSKVIDFKSGEWVLTLSDEKSLVDFGGINKKEGVVLYFRDKTGLYKIEQSGKKIDYTFSEPVAVYEWNLEYLPCVRLKGQPKNSEAELYYQSNFSPAISALNVALMDSNTLQVAKIAGAYPERWEYVDDCGAEGCEGGLVYDEERENPRRCHSCGGSGRKNYSSPLSVMQIPVPKEGMALSAQTDKMQPPFAGYVEKSGLVEMLKFLDEQVQHNCVSAFAFLNIDVSNTDAKGSDTALGKQIDREELFSFLMQISNELFDALGFSINTCGEVRYPGKWKDVEIGYPQNFAIRSDADLTEEISTAKTAGVPTMALSALNKEWLSNRFNSRVDIERTFDFTTKVDRLANLTPLEVSQKLSMQTAAKWEDVLHTGIDQFIELALEDDPGFWEKEFEERKQIITDMAKAVASEITPAQINVNDILNRAAQ